MASRLPTTEPRSAVLYGQNDSGDERAKRSFLAAMSHELRTRLNAIIGFAEIMDGRLFGPVSPDPYGSYVHDMLLAARCVLQIVDDVLQISQAEAGQLVLHKREIHVDSVVEAAIAHVMRLLPGRECRVYSDVPRDLMVQVDPEKVQRLLASLLSNAIKFSPDGARVQVSASIGASDEIKIVIADAGIGMSSKSIGRAFEPFVQIDDTLSRTFDGSGLGLPLARLLARLHGGDVHLRSALGEGTAATVTLPAYQRLTNVPKQGSKVAEELP